MTFKSFTYWITVFIYMGNVERPYIQLSEIKVKENNKKERLVFRAGIDSSKAMASLYWKPSIAGQWERTYCS